MPRVTDESLSASEKLFRPCPDEVECNVYRIILDLLDARTALQAIRDWKDRPTDEAPLTYIERVAREVVG